MKMIVGSKFHLKLTILAFLIKFSQKGYFRSETEKSEHNYRSLHIPISLGTKFRLKLVVFIFWTHLSKKGIFVLQQTDAV